MFARALPALMILAFPRAALAEGPVLHIDFGRDAPGVRLVHGASIADGALECKHSLQYAEVPLRHKLDGIKAMTVGGWFYLRRFGEQYLFFRGVPEVGPQGERLFRRQEQWVNFVLGTDQHGFLLGTINGSGTMPFPLVSLHEVPIDSWSQLVVVKCADGTQRLYANGTLVHTDRDSAWSGKVWPFTDTNDGEPVRLAVPLGGKIGEAWAWPRELSAEEIKKDFETRRERYRPALPVTPVGLREMDAHASTELWDRRGGPVTKQSWPAHRQRIRKAVDTILGPMPREKVPLDAKVLGEEDCGPYVRRKVSLVVQPGDRMPAYLLIPKGRKGRGPAILCFYGTTSGAGKETTVGSSGGKPGTPPERNRAFAVDMAEAGFVAFAADYLRDGERIAPGRRPYDTTDFYARFPDWSVHGKDAWDTMRAIDYLQTLDCVDPERIGMVGHSYGGHSTIFITAIEPRIKAAWANGPVSDFLHHGLHWAAPRGAGNSQSLPALRPFVLDPTRPIPVTFWEFTSLIAPRPLAVGQAVGERRPMEEENHAAVAAVYKALGASEKLRYVWYAGDHDFPPVARKAAVEWFHRWLGE